MGAFEVVKLAERLYCVDLLSLPTALLSRVFDVRPISFAIVSSATRRAAVALWSTALRMALRIPRVLSSDAHRSKADASTSTRSKPDTTGLLTDPFGPFVFNRDGTLARGLKDALSSVERLHRRACRVQRVGVRLKP
jgi:hypothetical protein